MARKNRVTPGTPDAVIKAGKAADELHEQIYGKPDGAPVAPEEQQVDEAPAANDNGAGGDIQPVEPQAPTESPGDTSTPVQEGGASVTEITPPSDPEPAPVAKPAEDFEQKYKALVQAQTAAPKAEEPDKPKKSVVTDADVVDYGEDLVDFVRRVAKAEAAEAASNLTPRIDQIQGQVVQSAAKQTTNTVYTKLDTEVQDWRNINKSPDFLEWLATPDPYAGDYRKNLLGAAFEAGDAERVTAFFNGYKAERQVVTPAPEHVNGQAPVDPAPKAGISLTDLAGPAGGSTQGNVDTQPAQPVSWSGAQISSFYNDCANGVFAKDPERKAQIEASIATAVKHGRVH